MAKFLDLTGLGQFLEKVKGWADGKFATKESVPTKVSQLTNDSDFQTGSQVDTKINAKVASVYKSKGTVETYSALPTEGNVVGDVYNVKAADAAHGIKAGDNVVWIGEGGGENADGWDNLGGKVDMSNYVQKEAGKGLSTNDYTNEEKQKLNELENYTHPSHTPQTSGMYKITVDALGHVTGAEAVQKTDITELGIPAQDTTYNPMTGASASAAGAAGLVPAPPKGGQDKYLAGDGTFKDIPSAEAISSEEIDALFN